MKVLVAATGLDSSAPLRHRATRGQAGSSPSSSYSALAPSTVPPYRHGLGLHRTLAPTPRTAYQPAHPRMPLPRPHAEVPTHRRGPQLPPRLDPKLEAIVGAPPRAQAGCSGALCSGVRGLHGGIRLARANAPEERGIAILALLSPLMQNTSSFSSPCWRRFGHAQYLLKRQKCIWLLLL